MSPPLFPPAPLPSLPLLLSQLHETAEGGGLFPTSVRIHLSMDLLSSVDYYNGWQCGDSGKGGGKAATRRTLNASQATEVAGREMEELKEGTDQQEQERRTKGLKRELRAEGRMTGGRGKRD